ncbi:hypothetical protein [Sphingobacterium sp. SGR-19]|uniref:hypothetical protein n=1 Tax=Sphingobacterium sp. SGR-19 TaxID=2710886 RepID=UPI0013ED801B|nr:hypothetical protein [Sphingobacterium sp. SGR-19]NGM64481.1 hypothetical protein [Sphingobacterium sp. SGR-19]
MKKSVIFLAFAMVMGTFLFMGKAKAGSVWLTYNFSNTQFYNIRFGVEYVNLDTDETYYREGRYKVEDGLPYTYNIGSVPDGNYRISIVPLMYSPLPMFGWYFTWRFWGGGPPSDPLLVELGYYTELTDNVYLGSHAEIVLEDW